jgi:AraC-like DNA-binding protein
MYGLPVESIVFTNYTQWAEHSNEDQHIDNPTDEELHKVTSYNDDETAVLFSDEYIEYLNEVLAKYYKNQKYLIETFKLSLISAESGIPLHHLTYYFNFILKTSFSDWRNKLRIEYAIHLFAQGAHKKMNLNGIAEQCGFSIPSTFIRSFKKFTGKTPSEYHKSLS